MVLLYLLSIVAANVVVAAFGTKSVFLVGFLLIGLDMATRDKLHERWKNNVFRNMMLLISAGAVITWILNHSAGRIAIASVAAFAVSTAVDAVVYHLLKHWKWSTRVNGSNAVSSMCDSMIFPTVAFGAIMPGVILGQFAVKVVGGFLWSKLLQGGEDIGTRQEASESAR